MYRQCPRQGQEFGTRIGKGLLVTARGLVTGRTADQHDQRDETGDQPPTQPGGRMLGMGRKGVPQGQRGQGGLLLTGQTRDPGECHQSSSLPVRQAII